METDQYGLEPTNGNGRNHDGTFLPGNKVSAGRGPNRVSQVVRESLIKFLEANIESVQESFDKLKPLEKLQFVANILPYVVPKMSTLQTESYQDTNHTGKITIEIVKSNGILESNTGI
jgi:hypothetical protein